MIYVLLFFIFVALVVFHFIYDGILAPSFRFELRLQLFQIRDRIRMLKILHGDQLDDKLYFHMQDSVNKQIRLLHNINVVGVIQAFRMAAKNKELAARLAEIEKLVSECEINEIKELFYFKVPGKFGLALATNSGGWSIYVVAFLVPFIVISMVCVFAGVWIRNLVNKILEMPDDALSDSFAYR